jgi:hypothetical protein
MPVVTLFVRVYDNSQLKLIDKILKSTLKGLNVETKICGVTPRGRVQISVCGEDEKVALLYLADEVGLCPTDLEHLEKFSTIKGSITSLDKNRNELCVDIGVSSPDVIDATIPIQRLQAQLTDGRKTALKKIVELFGFCQGLPLSVKILHIDEGASRIEAMLSEKQIIQYTNWMRSLLDRLIVLGAPLHEVSLALKGAGFSRDVLGVEPSGLFEHTVVCKLGTDAAGLIPKIGRRLRTAKFTVFNPRKVLEFLDYSPLFTSW